MEAATVARAPAAAPKRVPRDRPRPKSAPKRRPKATASARAGTARASAATAPAVAPRPRTAPKRRTAPSRAPGKRRAPVRRPGGQLIPIAVGTAAAVKHLPDTGLVVRLTRGRAWIGVLGVLLAGIVALNVVTLSYSASTGHIEENVAALEKENDMLSARVDAVSGVSRVGHDAAAIGLGTPQLDGVTSIQVTRGDAAVAAQRLAAAGG